MADNPTYPFVIIAFMAKKAVFLFLVLQAIRVPAWGEIQSPQCKGAIHGAVFDVSGQRAKGIMVELWPLGVDLGIVLPRVKTDEAGKYRFQNVCAGRYTVTTDDKRTGYPHSSPYLNEFLYGTSIAEVKLTARHPRAELRVDLPPKPGFIQVHIVNRETKADVMRFSVKLKVPRQHRRSEASFEFDISVDDHNIPVPPDKDVIFHVTADGFHEWSESAGHGKVIRIPSGTQGTLKAELEPLNGHKPNRLRQDGFW